MNFGTQEISNIIQLGVAVGTLGMSAIALYSIWQSSARIQVGVSCPWRDQDKRVDKILIEISNTGGRPALITEYGLVFKGRYFDGLRSYSRTDPTGRRIIEENLMPLTVGEAETKSIRIYDCKQMREPTWFLFWDCLQYLHASRGIFARPVSANMYAYLFRMFSKKKQAQFFLTHVRLFVKVSGRKTIIGNWGTFLDAGKMADVLGECEKHHVVLREYNKIK
jgi:hypothetical protein